MVRFYFRIWLHLVELQVIAFWGGPYRFTWFGAFFNTIGPSLTKVVYAYFDGSSYLYPVTDSSDSQSLPGRIVTVFADLCGLSKAHSAQRTLPKDLAAPGAAVHKADSNHLESTNRTTNINEEHTSKQ